MYAEYVAHDMNPPDSSRSTSSTNQEIVNIPVEIISEEEMALIEAAFAAVERTAFPLTQLHQNARSVRNITLLSKRRLSACSGNESRDVEDSAKKNRVLEPFLHRFRSRKGRGLSITDITGTEWCEKQIEFSLLRGKPKQTAAMKAGCARHLALEEEVIKRVKVQVESAEDIWALKLINFIVGTNQLIFDGLTRELPLVGFAEGVWMVGIIDELRMPGPGHERMPIIVDTKTRVRATAPSEAQKRNGRLQLMCYKYLWDNLVADDFPTQKFLVFFSLNPNQILSPEIRESTEKSGFPSQTLNEVLNYFKSTCRLLPRADDQLLLRYELQKDESFLGEDGFLYEPDLLKGQLRSSLEFWLGEREARYPPIEERWKCRFCKFAPDCPATLEEDVLPSEANFTSEILLYGQEENTSHSEVLLYGQNASQLGQPGVINTNEIGTSE